MHHQVPGTRPAPVPDHRGELRRPPQLRPSREHGNQLADVSDQADSSERPLRRRAARMARPARVRLRNRKPCVLARRRLFGWKVRLLTVVSPRRIGTARVLGPDSPRLARIAPQPLLRQHVIRTPDSNSEADADDQPDRLTQRTATWIGPGTRTRLRNPPAPVKHALRLVTVSTADLVDDTPSALPVEPAALWEGVRSC